MPEQQVTDPLLQESDDLQDFTFPKGTMKGLLLTLIFAVLSLVLYNILPFEVNASKGLALLFFIGALWLTEALHVTITAILVVIISGFLGIEGIDAPTSLKHFANHLIFLFFGGFALAAALHVQKLDKKIAIKIIGMSGGKLGPAVFSVFGVTAFLSMWISNTATAAMMLPLGLGLLTQIDSEKDRGTFVFVLLGIAYSASLGGLGTIIGSPPNGIAAEALSISFREWMWFGIPIMLVLLPVLIGTMYMILKPNLGQTIGTAGKEEIPWTQSRVLTMIVFCTTALLWIFSKRVSDELGGIAKFNTVIALSAVVAVVSLGLVKWKQVSDNTDWGVLMLFGGGIALSNILKVSGASKVLGESVAHMLSTSPLLLVLLVIAGFIIFLTEFASNTASAALLVPVFAAIATEMGVPKEVLVLIIGIGASCAFMLPVATPPNAIVFGTGLIKQKEMLRIGVVLNIISIVVVGFWAYFFLA